MTPRTSYIHIHTKEADTTCVRNHIQIERTEIHERDLPRLGLATHEDIQPYVYMQTRVDICLYLIGAQIERYTDVDRQPGRDDA